MAVKHLAIVLAFAFALIAVRGASASDDPQKIFVLGGTRGTGLEIVKVLRQRGDDVTALVRASSNTESVASTGAQLIVGDVLDRASLDDALAGGAFSVVVSTIGGRVADGTRVDGIGNINAIEAAKAAGIRRFILVSTIGARESYDALNKMMEMVLKDTLEAKDQAERHLVDSGLDFTIVRPGGLFDGEPSGKGILSDDASIFGSIARSELALLVVRCVDDASTVGKTYSAIEVWD